MAIHTILSYPDPRLRKIAKPVETFSESLKQLVSDMIETMYDAQGIGLAATQINQHIRVIVMDLSEHRDEAKIFINPTIEIIDPTLFEYKEGCLSVPHTYDNVKRPRHVKIKAQDEHGAYFEEDAQELLAVCIQHEIDHLNGKLFVDYLSRLKQNRIKTKIKKLKN
jgi:peptide deformylase